MNKLAIAVIGSTLAFGALGQSMPSVSELCAAYQSQTEKLNDQFPLRIDYMTQITGTSAIYVSGKCMVNTSYLIDEAKFINEVSVELPQLGRNDLIELVNDNEFKAIMADALYQQAFAGSSVEQLLKLGGFTLNASYLFDGGQVSPIRFSVDKNGLRKK